ncbi:MAG: polyamine aminopropyltransferase [Candidatus Marinimicrobia bacterium]|nr:polyamine aminopropyltransferase [Candidatus Neomarinimicrobiota bacterium]
MSFHKKSNILKYALFATGLSGIVAEYILATLATYFLGNSVFQWTMIISIMLFSMGMGSRISKYFEVQLLKNFLLIEFSLSILTSFSAISVYYLSVFSSATGFFIYLLAIMIGILIGMEIPLVIRLNDTFEELKVNIATVMEKDYYGSFVGGLFFAFVGLPYLGLAYTPFILGSINFIVAVAVFLKLRKPFQIQGSSLISGMAFGISILLVAGFIYSKPIILYGEQVKYKDKIVYSEQSRYQKIVITQWKNNYWLFIDGNQQLSTLDEWLYHEPLVHPVMQLSELPHSVLILGGGDGCAVREVLKYREVQQITVVDIDPAMTTLGQTHPILTEVNQNALNHPKVNIVNRDAYQFLNDSQDYFDIIIADLPDPKTVELGRLYSLEFYQLCYRLLRPRGLIVTQAGSPYYATQAFQCIEKTMTAAGFQTLPLHNQVLTMGEWGWVLGSKSIPKLQLKAKLLKIDFNNIETRWINNEAMNLILSFGKPIFSDKSEIEVNTLINPRLYQYYLKGNWDIY